MLNLLVGLGNPGNKYKFTRHNLGFRVVDALASRSHQRFKPGKGDYLYCEIEPKAGPIFHLIKSLTFMNDSGVAVIEAMENLNRGKENLLVICDDVNLPLGKLRIREKGTDGGHKGLGSIIYHLNSSEFARLRMGIGEPPEEMDLEEFVLREFEEEEKHAAADMIEKACLAVENMLIKGVENSMSRFNV